MEGLALFLTLISILLAISFYVAVERKVLGLLQGRHGPNKPGLLGIILPLVDGVKLISKEVLRPSVREAVLFVGGPMAVFIISFRA
jgi:NADH-quinone oxidoreductase subunit H